MSPGQCWTLKVTEVPRPIEAVLLKMLYESSHWYITAQGGPRCVEIPARLLRLANRWTTPRMAVTLSWSLSRMRVGAVQAVP